MAKSVLITYAIASASLAFGILLHVPGFYVEFGGRVTTLRDNANNVVAYMAIAVAILIGLYLKTVYRHFINRIRFLVLIPPLLMIMVSTGSRGGIAAFIIGCSVYLLPPWRSKRKLTAITLAILSIGATVYMVASNPVFLQRWQSSYDRSDMAGGREYIFPVALEMFLERPIFGWQPHEFLYELGRRRFGEEHVDTHNLLLYLLLQGGIVGTIPFVVGFWLCGCAAWRARRGHLGLLPLALISLILAISLSGTTLFWKPQWLILALTLAAASAASHGTGEK